jgi:signal transduction histidine kinase
VTHDLCCCNQIAKLGHATVWDLCHCGHIPAIVTKIPRRVLKSGFSRGPDEGTLMRIAQFIRTHPAEIEAAWERFARTLSSFAPDLRASELRDHLREILVAMADDMETPQNLQEQAEKSEGRGPRGGALDLISAIHARSRLNSGFNLEQAISEYRALRSSILFLWVRSRPSNDEVVLSEVTRFNETIDQAIAEVVRRFADRSERYSDVFLGILTHEVRNFLNIIRLSGETLKTGGSLPEAQSASTARILKGVGSIDRLMNDLSIVVRSRMRVKLPLTMTDGNLGEICEQTLEEVKASHHGTDFELKTTGDVRGTWDHDRLGQVIFNLVVNAVIHAWAKRVCIIAEGQGPDVVLRVTNRGVPIPAEMQESIFDPFVTNNTASSSTLAKTGLGLGLFIVREIVNAHDGRVGVTSSESEGTTFTVRLPRVPRSNIPPEATTD